MFVEIWCNVANAIHRWNISCEGALSTEVVNLLYNFKKFLILLFIIISNFVKLSHSIILIITNINHMQNPMYLPCMFWIYVPTSSFTSIISINRLLWIRVSRMSTKFSTSGVLTVYASIFISNPFYLKYFLWPLTNVWHHFQHSTICI